MYRRLSLSKTDAKTSSTTNNCLTVGVTFRSQPSRIREVLRGRWSPASQTAPDITIEGPKRQLPREAYRRLPRQPESSAELQERKSKVCFGRRESFGMSELAAESNGSARTLRAAFLCRAWLATRARRRALARRLASRSPRLGIESTRFDARHLVRGSGATGVAGRA